MLLARGCLLYSFQWLASESDQAARVKTAFQDLDGGSTVVSDLDDNEKKQ